MPKALAIAVLLAIAAGLMALVALATPKASAVGTAADVGAGLSGFADAGALQAFARKMAQQERQVFALMEPPPGIEAAVPEFATEFAADASITNTQKAGVDEGGIVKRAGDYLVVLRRGRLFTIRDGDDALTPVAAIDAFAPDKRNPQDT